ncbi:hypothetical protein D3C72_1548890 [compost metagenome]
MAQDQHAVVAPIHLLDLFQRRARLQDKTVLRVAAGDIRRRLQIHIHALRTILEKPATAFVLGVIAVDEIQQGRMDDLVAGQLLLLRLLVAHAPVAARVQPQPAVAVGYVRPFGQGLLDEFIHV